MEELLFGLNDIGGIELWEVIDAYYHCRRRKRSTVNAMKFEIYWEEECRTLWEEINSGHYRPGRSIAFIVNKPVKREIFAADFRDRVVHHLIADKIIAILEAQFINDSYSTREGKGTLFGIHRVAQQISEISHDYTEDCYIMKVDIEGFFMSIIKEMLCEEAEQIVRERYRGNDRELLLHLLRLTVKNRPEKNCVRKTPPSSWRGLPRRKTLFGTDGTVGLPIGNLTSQLLALLHLDPLDHLIRDEWGVEGYGRYVDDMVLIDHSREKLLDVRKKIDRWLLDHGHRLHRRKFYLQHYRKGVLFVGGMIRPGRILMGHRSLSFCMESLHGYNEILRRKGWADDDLIQHFISSMNSYFGLMQQYKTFRVAHQVLLLIDPQWFNYVTVVSKGGKIKIAKIGCKKESKEGS
jgi:retron-type reverse transcriptase